jgi:hypothetical protein
MLKYVTLFAVLLVSSIGVAQADPPTASDQMMKSNAVMAKSACDSAKTGTVAARKVAIKAKFQAGKDADNCDDEENLKSGNMYADAGSLYFDKGETEYSAGLMLGQGSSSPPKGGFYYDRGDFYWGLGQWALASKEYASAVTAYTAAAGSFGRATNYYNQATGNFSLASSRYTAEPRDEGPGPGFPPMPGGVF